MVNIKISLIIFFTAKDGEALYSQQKQDQEMTPLSTPSPPAPNPSQHQGLFQGVSSAHQVAKVLEFQLQHQSFQ